MQIDTGELDPFRSALRGAATGPGDHDREGRRPWSLATELILPDPVGVARGGGSR